MQDMKNINIEAQHASFKRTQLPPMTELEAKLHKELKRERDRREDMALRYYQEKEYHERAMANMEKYARRVQYKWEKLRVHCWAAWSIVAALCAALVLK